MTIIYSFLSKTAANKYSNRIHQVQMNDLSILLYMP